MSIIACPVEGESHTQGRLTKGLCAKHYQRLRQHGSTTPTLRSAARGLRGNAPTLGPASDRCSVDGDSHTGGGYLRQGMCEKHYERMQKHGTPILVHELTCAACGTLFGSSKFGAKYCSAECKPVRKQRSAPLTCCLCDKTMVRSRTSKPQGEAAHNACRVGHGTVGEYSKGCRCESCKGAKNASIREYNAKVKARDGVSHWAQSDRKARGVDPFLTIPDCSICKKPLINAPRGAERPMHKTCRTAAPQWQRAGGETPKVTAFRRKMELAAAGTTGGKRVFVNGSCEWCGDLFTAASGRFCSKSCRASDKFRRRGSGLAFNPSKRERKAVYDRDRWTCQICSNPVPVGVLWGSPWYPTLDHIIPQSKMIVPDHSPSNLRLVHSWCNSARGDGSNMAEMELVERARKLFSERVTLAA